MTDVIIIGILVITVVASIYFIRKRKNKVYHLVDPNVLLALLVKLVLGIKRCNMAKKLSNK